MRDQQRRGARRASKRAARASNEAESTTTNHTARRGTYHKGLRAVREQRDRILDAIATSHQRVLDESVVVRRGSRKRAIPVAMVGFAALVGMYQAVANNVLAVNFTTTNNSFKLYSNYLQGENVAAYLNRTSRSNGSDVGVAELGVATAHLAGLCAIVNESLPVVGKYALVLTAGDKVAGAFTPSYSSGTFTAASGYTATVDPSGATAGQLNGTSLSNAISANNLFINTPQLTGFGNMIGGLNLGESAGTVGTTAGVTWPTPGTGLPPKPGTGTSDVPAGNFGLSAQKLNVGALNGDTYGLNLAGAITLPKLKISMVKSSDGSDLGQSVCPTSAS